MTPHAASRTSVRDIEANAKASLVGGTFAHRLREAGLRGEVIFVGSKGAYIETHRSELLGLGRHDQPAHARMVLSDLDLTMLQPGMPVRANETCLTIGDSIVLELDEAPVWEPQPITPEIAQPLTDSRTAFDEAVGIATVLQDGSTLGCVLPMIQGAALHNKLPPFQATGSLFLDDAMNHISGIMMMCVQGDLEGALSNAMPLIGAGPGLTPSGDDFVGGLLFSARHLSNAYPSASHWDSACAERLLSFAEGRTGRISFAALQDMASGYGHEPVHTLMGQLLTGEKRSETMASIVATTRIGNTSGWDMLAGLFTGMLLMSNKN